MKAIIILMMALMVLPAAAEVVAPLITDVKVSQDGDEVIVTAIVVGGTNGIDIVNADISAFADDTDPLGYVELDKVIPHGNMYAGRFKATITTNECQPIAVYVKDTKGVVTVSRSCYLSVETAPETAPPSKTPLIAAILMIAGLFILVMYAKRKR